MVFLSKPARATDEDFLDFVRQHPCTVCGESGVHAHHLRTRGAGGSDYTAVPLCGLHHQQWHQLGNRPFREKTGVDLWHVSAQLVAEYFSDPAVILRKALAIVARPELEITPDISAVLASLEATLKGRRAA